MEGVVGSIGCRVLVIGMAGAGKSTFSRALSARTGLPVIHLDFHYWKPGWVKPSNDEWREKQRGLLAGPAWIADGNDLETLDLRLERAETVVLLDTPWWICAGRALFARASKAGRRNARRLRRFRNSTVAGRVAADLGRLAPPPFRDRASTRDDLVARKARGAARDRVETGSARVPQHAGLAVTEARLYGRVSWNAPERGRQSVAVAHAVSVAARSDRYKGCSALGIALSSGSDLNTCPNGPSRSARAYVSRSSADRPHGSR